VPVSNQNFASEQNVDSLKKKAIQIWLVCIMIEIGFEYKKRYLFMYSMPFKYSNDRRRICNYAQLIPFSLYPGLGIMLILSILPNFRELLRNVVH